MKLIFIFLGAYYSLFSENLDDKKIKDYIDLRQSECNKCIDNLDTNELDRTFYYYFIGKLDAFQEIKEYIH